MLTEHDERPSVDDFDQRHAGSAHAPIATPSVLPIASRSFSERTDEGRAYLQSRIALFAKTMFLLMVGYMLFVGIFSALVADAHLQGEPLWMVLGMVAVSGLLSMWLYARGKTRSVAAVIMLDYGCVIASGLLVGISVYLMRHLMIAPMTAIHPDIGGFVGMTLMVFGRALIVPSTIGRTAAASTLAMAPLLVSTVVLATSHPDAQLLAPIVQIAFIGVWSTIAVLVASFGSGVIYGLREQVRAARQLGQYTLLQKIGEGGMGAVYQARHAMLRRPTAIKLLSPGKAGEKQLARFEREVQHTAELTHPNTVAIYDYGRSPDGVFYYVMEHLHGIDLDALVDRFGPQPPARVVHILRQICGALAEAHDHGLIHRDIKPANIFLCHRGGVADVVKVLDFGLVKNLERLEGSLSDVNVLAGTPAFLSPEAITNPERVGPEADIYALGGVAYYLLAGRNVFDGATAVEICGHHVHSAPEPPSKYVGEPLPAKLEQLVLQCLAKKPKDRPSSARELARALERALQDAGDVEPWDEVKAERWWTEHRLRQDAASERAPITGLEPAIQVDMSSRALGG